jgi:hypothetical protein
MLQEKKEEEEGVQSKDNRMKEISSATSPFFRHEAPIAWFDPPFLLCGLVQESTSLV